MTKKISYKVYSSKYYHEWENFVENEAVNSTILHTRKFFNHNDLNEIDDNSLMFYYKNELICVLPAILKKSNNKKIYYSHPRATYGGFVVSKKITPLKALDIVKLTISNAIENDCNEIIIRNPFKIIYNDFYHDTDYAMACHNFVILNREFEIYINLNDFAYKKTNHHEIRKSYNLGVKVVESDNYQEFWSILTNNLQKKYNKNPVHNLESFQVLIKNLGDEKVKLFAAYLDNKMIGGLVLFYLNKKAVHCQYIASIEEYNKYYPVKILTDTVIKDSIEKGYTYLNLGNCIDINNKINEGLMKFKLSFGGRTVLRETMSLKF